MNNGKKLIVIFSFVYSLINASPEQQAKSEIAFLFKFVGVYSKPIYVALQACLKEEDEKASLSCQSGLTLLLQMKNVIKDKNIAITSNEKDLLNAMEEKYSKGSNNKSY